MKSLTRFFLHSMAVSPSPETERPRVTYWAGRGLAEPIRCILAAAGVPFDNIFLEEKEDLQTLIDDDTLAYDQVPLVQIDGMNLVQSGPTAEYLAESYGLMPQGPRERFLVGQILSASRDARAPFVSFPFHLDKEKLLEEIKGPKGLFGRYCVKWESQLAKTTRAGSYFLDTQPSLADVSVFEVMDFYRHVFGESAMRSSFANFPLLLEMHDAVLNLGQLKAWRDEERPKMFIQEWSDYADVVVRTLS